MNGTAQTTAVEARPRVAATDTGAWRRAGLDHDAHHDADHEDARYDRVRDRRLAATLAAEDRAADAGLDPFERLSCRIHDRWLHHCIHSAVHVVQVSGPLVPLVPVARGGRGRRAHGRHTRHLQPLRPDAAGRASRQIIRTCTASIAAAEDH